MKKRIGLFCANKPYEVYPNAPNTLPPIPYPLYVFFKDLRIYIPSGIKSSDYLELMEAVKENIKSTVDRSLQLSLLTLAPASWTHKTNKWSFFHSEYSAAQAIELKKKSGILAIPEAFYTAQE
jgi:hypothetical protein